MKVAYVYPAILTIPTAVHALGEDGPGAVGQEVCGFAGPGKDPQQLWEATGRHPNATSSVTFARVNAPETWIWRVNVTETGGLNNYYQRNWPGDSDTFQSFLGQQNLTAQFNVIVFSPPPQVDQYNDNDNGNCGPIFGDTCVEAIKDAASTGDSVYPDDLNECEKFKDYSGMGFGLATQNTNLSSNSSEYAALHRGDTLFFLTSPTYTSGNKTVLRDSERALQLLVMTLTYKGAQDTNGSVSDTTVLCRIVKKDATFAAIRWYPSSLALWGIVMSFLIIW